MSYITVTETAQAQMITQMVTVTAAAAAAATGGCSQASGLSSLRASLALTPLVFLFP